MRLPKKVPNPRWKTPRHPISFLAFTLDDFPSKELEIGSMLGHDNSFSTIK